jgi:hypothetical protein
VFCIIGPAVHLGVCPGLLAPVKSMLRSKRIDPISRLQVLLPDRVCWDLELDFTFTTKAFEVDRQN